VLIAARQLALTVFFVPLDDAAQLDTALATVTRERADALLLPSTGPNIVRRHEIAKFALRHRLPSVADMREIAEAGSLLTYMPDYFDMFRARRAMSTGSSRGRSQGISRSSRATAGVWPSTSRPLRNSASRSLRRFWRVRIR
jgi:putative ABC transport system substrate-binding protein